MPSRHPHADSISSSQSSASLYSAYDSPPSPSPPPFRPHVRRPFGLLTPRQGVEGLPLLRVFAEGVDDFTAHDT